MRIPKNIFKTKPTEFTWAILAITRFFLALIVLIHHMDYYFNLTEGSIIFEFIELS